jgi:hypothetical protein
MAGLPKLLFAQIALGSMPHLQNDDAGLTGSTGSGCPLLAAN